MYPRNAASPPSIAIGAVVKISDGAVQTSGITVYHRTTGTTENAGGGTPSVGATTGTVYYTPTQAETNYESFELVAFKAGCIPATVTVVTSASSTAGQTVVGTNNDKTGYTASTVSDKTGYALTSAYDAAKTAATQASVDTIDGIVDTIVSRVVGTLAAGTHTAQSGDAYAVVNSGTYGNSALRTLLTSTGVVLTSAERTTLAAALEAAIINELDGTAVMQAIADLIASDMTTTDLTVAAIASACRDAILNRVLAGNHDTSGTTGKVLQDIVADTNEVQAELADGGRTDVLIDSIVTYVDCLPATWVTVPTAAQNASQVRTELTTELERIDAAVTTRAPSSTALSNLTWTDTKAGYIDSAVSSRSSHDATAVVTALGTGSTLTACATATSVTVSDKTGFKLASDGLDSISTAAPTGVASDFREMIVQTWRRFFKKAVRTYTGGTKTIKTYADNGSTVLTTQPISDDGTDETQGAAS